MLISAVDVCAISSGTMLRPAHLTCIFAAVTIASRVSLIVADCVLILVTWFSISRPQHVQMRKNTFATVLLRDGEQASSADRRSSVFKLSVDMASVGLIYFL